MKPKGKKPPHSGEAGSKPTAARINPPPSDSNRFDTVERKLSLTLDALLDAIEAYRELKR
jgi:hypothetical protein